jgi:hypothetical protein
VSIESKASIISREMRQGGCYALETLVVEQRKGDRLTDDCSVVKPGFELENYIGAL